MLLYSVLLMLGSSQICFLEFFCCQLGYLVRCYFLGSHKCTAIYVNPNFLDAAILSSMNVRLSLWFDISLYSFWQVRIRKVLIF